MLRLFLLCIYTQSGIYIAWSIQKQFINYEFGFFSSSTSHRASKRRTACRRIKQFKDSHQGKSGIVIVTPPHHSILIYDCSTSNFWFGNALSIPLCLSGIGADLQSVQRQAQSGGGLVSTWFPLRAWRSRRVRGGRKRRRRSQDGPQQNQISYYQQRRPGTFFMRGQTPRSSSLQFHEDHRHPISSMWVVAVQHIVVHPQLVKKLVEKFPDAGVL